MGWVRQGDKVWYEEGEAAFNDQWRYYESHQPRLISAFQAQRVSHLPLQGGGHGEPIQIDYVVACACGSGSLGLEAGWDVDGAFWLSPVVAACKACGRREALFDGSVHGHDAENGFVPEPGNAAIRSLPIEPGDRLIVSFYYPDDGFEFDRIGFLRDAPIDEPRPEDCFTWIRLTRQNARITESLVDFECA